MSKLAALLQFMGAVLILTALGLTVYNLGRSDAAAETDARLVEALHQTLPPPVQPAAADTPAEVQKSAYAVTPEAEMPVVQVEGRGYVGLLSIPKLELELPVIAAWDYPSLRVAPCRYTGSAYTDDMVIAAHNYASHFGRLQELSNGDSLFFTDMDGNVFAYTVEDMELLGPYAVSQMTQSGWDLTLFTCTPGGRQRVTVRCGRAA